MVHHSAFKVIGFFTVLWVAWIPLTYAAPSCDEVNYHCEDPYLTLMTSPTDECVCCPMGTDTNNSWCTRARSRCSFRLLRCPDYRVLTTVDDVCQCCYREEPTLCVAPENMCPDKVDSLCIACADGKCTHCAYGYKPAADGVACSPCVVPHCKKCFKEDPLKCSVCEDEFEVNASQSCHPKSNEESVQSSSESSMQSSYDSAHSSGSNEESVQSSSSSINSESAHDSEQISISSESSEFGTQSSSDGSADEMQSSGDEEGSDSSNHGAAPSLCGPSHYQCLNPKLTVYEWDDERSVCWCCSASDIQNTNDNNNAKKNDGACEIALPRCRSGLYKCRTSWIPPEHGYYGTCECCDENGCYAAAPKCAEGVDPLCITCDAHGKCGRCAPGYAAMADGTCQPCMVPNCKYCVSDDVLHCECCEHQYALTETKTCKSRG